ncbi:unnamed protein product [Rotaria socialis]|uniref:Uncharacterized protein n=1 Tax=Rotaria socialis TaxID=392032 RepID=A0A818X729_9BILA|nr:unnamed protein product [Rotaria socialis]CAF4798303.1 unnamed protein product [Rotaria socialis]
MHPEERWNQNMRNHLEGFVDLQLLEIQQEEIEEMQRLDEAENYGEQRRLENMCLREEWEQAQLDRMDTQATTFSYTTIIDQLKQIRQMHELERDGIQQQLETVNSEQQQCRVLEQGLHDYPQNT